MEYSSVAILLGTLLATASILLVAKYKQGKGKAKQLTRARYSLIEVPEALQYLG